MTHSPVAAINVTARKWLEDVWDTWNRFWFTPAQPHTIAVIRILGGWMMFYTHFVWSLDLMSFLGPHCWTPVEMTHKIHAQIESSWTAWSYLYYVQSPALIWLLHILGLVVFAMLTMGLFSRASSVLAFLITMSYCHRLTGSWFGLDQVNALISLYLMFAPCGAVYSVDRWLLGRRSAKKLPAPESSVGSNLAMRLIQLHLCIIYLFGGISKMTGDSWWNGSAVWYAVANLEYQSLDMTWLVHFPWVIALLTHVTVFWETFYCALVWPRLTRPITLILAVGVHGGIALFMGMITFGVAMIIANLAFVSPRTVRNVVDWTTQKVRGAGQGSAEGRSTSSKVGSRQTSSTAE